MRLVARPRKAERTRQDSSRSAAEQLVRSLNPGPMWTVDSFVVEQSFLRNRPIRIVNASGDSDQPHGITGQLWPYESHDEIVVSAGLSETERRYVIAHEMGHLLLDHPRRASSHQWTQWLNALPPSLVTAQVGSFVCHVGHASELDLAPLNDGERAEQEAEWFASILLAHVDEKRSRIAAHRGHERGAVMIDRIARSFGYY